MSDRLPVQRGMNELRVAAEQRVNQPHADTVQLSDEDVATLVYELEIHREELEIQNEELRRAYSELEKSHDRYIDLYDFAPVGYLTLTAEGNIAEANLTACEMLGRERAGLHGVSLLLLCDLDSRAAFRNHLDEVLTAGEPRTTVLRLASDRECYLQMQTCRTSGASDTDAYRTVITNATARVQAERVAVEKHRQLRAVTDALPVLIGYLNPELRLQDSNAALHQWFGCSAAELASRRIQTLIGEHNQDVDRYFAAALAGRRVDFELCLSHRQHGDRQVLVTVVPDTRDGKVLGLHFLGIDVTDRKLIQNQLDRRSRFTERLIRLSASEKQVYDLLIRGKSNKAIAKALDIGLRTAERRRQSIIEKLEVDSVADLLQHLSDIQNVIPEGAVVQAKLDRAGPAGS